MALARGLLLAAALSLLFLAGADAGTVGVNWGRVANDLPNPASVVQLLKQHGIGQVKLYDTEPTVLRALANSGIKVVVALPNEQLAAAAKRPSYALAWVRRNVAAYYPATQIQGIAVGNEVFATAANVTSQLVPAMANVHAALARLNMDKAVKVSSPIALTALAASYPPSAGVFREELSQAVMKPMLDFLSRTGSYLMVNAYPFFAYADNAGVISLDYALFRPNAGELDSGSGLKYYSLLDAQLDAVFTAVGKLGSYNGVRVVVSETGWPSKGDAKEVGASAANAAGYNGNLVRRVLSGNAGTPRRPDADVDVYLFALFNENQKPGPTSERNYGVFYPNQQQVYDVEFVLGGKGNVGSGGGGGLGWQDNGNNAPAAGGGGGGVKAAVAPGAAWCVANAVAGEGRLKAALDYACGPGGADCRGIQPGAACFEPNTMVSHASYAFNDYYQRKGRSIGTCDFAGAAYVVSQAPNAGTVGVNWGRVANDLPNPASVVQLLKQHGIGQVKLYDTEPTVLRALANSGIKVVVALPNEQLAAAAKRPSYALAWVRRNVAAYYPATQIQGIAVGNEVFATAANVTSQLVPAMANVHAALARLNMDKAVKVSSPIALTALAASYPPSAGVFREELSQAVMKPMLDFLSRTGSYLMVNAYPFFAYADNAGVISLDYALFRPNAGELDSGSGLKYYSLLDAQLDAVFTAVGKLGSYNGVRVVVSETGWPSKGDAKEVGASAANAAGYNGNLVRRVLSGNAGTPRRPDADVDVYLFALFNENQKPGPTSERNYGVFYPNQQQVYDVEFVLGGKGNVGSGGGGGLGWQDNGNNAPAAGGGGGGVKAAVAPGAAWCVANAVAGEGRLKAALDYACGPGGADCRGIQPGAACFEPNTMVSHASYAFNDYYQRKGRSIGTCDFAGAAYVVSQAPKMGKCELPSTV